MFMKMMVAITASTSKVAHLKQSSDLLHLMAFGYNNLYYMMNGTEAANTAHKFFGNVTSDVGKVNLH